MSKRPLHELITRLEERNLLAAPFSATITITSAPTHESRLVSAGGIFVAIAGHSFDGAAVITIAVGRGRRSSVSKYG
jgi:UDP-N-acetylmuramyl tripeptide synthase